MYQVIYLRCTVFLVDVNFIRMTRTYQEVYVRAFFISSVVGGWELPLFMVQILTHPNEIPYPFFPPRTCTFYKGLDLFPGYSWFEVKWMFTKQ